MSKTLEASCAAGVVTVEGVPLVGATILSEGVGDSEGIAILDEDKSFYVAKTVPDLKTTLEKLIDVLGQVKDGLTKAGDALTALDTAAFLIGATAGVPSPPIAAPDIAGVTAAASAIDPIVSDLTTLMESLK